MTTRAEAEKLYIIEKLSGRLVSLWHEDKTSFAPVGAAMIFRPYTFEEYYRKLKKMEFKSRYKVKTKRIK